MNNPTLLAYAVKNRGRDKKATWLPVSDSFPNHKSVVTRSASTIAQILSEPQ